VLLCRFGIDGGRLRHINLTRTLSYLDQLLCNTIDCLSIYSAKAL
jgi:hypothetical protein